MVPRSMNLLLEGPWEDSTSMTGEVQVDLRGVWFKYRHTGWCKLDDSRDFMEFEDGIVWWGRVQERRRCTKWRRLGS